MEINSDSKHLDIGCGSNPRNPFGAKQLFAVDIVDMVPEGIIFKRANLSMEKIPFPDNFFDSVSAYDFLEHVPRILQSTSSSTRFPFIELMNEVWRVLKPNGTFYAETPAFPSPAAFQDPTHVNIITQRTHKYFCGSDARANIYGYIGNFEVICVKWIKNKSESRKRNFLKTIAKLFNIIKTKNSTHLSWELTAIK